MPCSSRSEMIPFNEACQTLLTIESFFCWFSRLNDIMTSSFRAHALLMEGGPARNRERMATKRSENASNPQIWDGKRPDVRTSI